MGTGLKLDETLRSLWSHGEHKHAADNLLYTPGLVWVMLVPKRVLTAQRYMVCLGREKLT